MPQTKTCPVCGHDMIKQPKGDGTDEETAQVWVCTSCGHEE